MRVARWLALMVAVGALAGAGCRRVDPDALAKAEKPAATKLVAEAEIEPRIKPAEQERPSPPPVEVVNIKAPERPDALKLDMTSKGAPAVHEQGSEQQQGGASAVVRKDENGITRYKDGYRYEKGGWVFVHIEGKPYARGFQHGYLVADLYREALAATKAMTFETLGKRYDFFVEQAVRLHRDKIPQELIDEMRGIADGLTEAGVPTAVDDIIGWNAYIEMTEYWWPNAKKQHVKSAANQSQPDTGPGKGNCSAFIATGSATADGGIVMGHETFDDFWTGQAENLILDIKPDKGFAMIMQAMPAYIDSMTDFFITSAGIVGSETTIAGFSSYDESGVPEYVRVRMAMQQGKGLDQFVDILNEGNNGGVANVWLLGDVNTGEIAQFEQGLLYTNYQKKKDGYWTGNNAVVDPRIRNLECAGVGYNDIRQQTGARRVRWPAVVNEYLGRITADIGKVMLADHFDVYEQRMQPSARTICSHYDEDRRAFMSSPLNVWPNPYTPAGSIDAKVTTSAMAKDMKMWARFGRACGAPFDAEVFLEKQPQWNWQQDYLKSRPHQPYVTFQSGGTN